MYDRDSFSADLKKLLSCVPFLITKEHYIAGQLKNIKIYGNSTTIQHIRISFSLYSICFDFYDEAERCSNSIPHHIVLRSEGEYMSNMFKCEGFHIPDEVTCNLRFMCGCCYTSDEILDKILRIYVKDSIKNVKCLISLRTLLLGTKEVTTTIVNKLKQVKL